MADQSGYNPRRDGKHRRVLEATVYLLEANFTVLVVNAQHIKTVPGRKTDVQDAEWIADLLGHGLLRGSFIPPLPQRDLRDLTRQRTLLVQERATVVNWLQKVLEWANLKLASVASNVIRVSARTMLAAIVDGQIDGTVLAELAQGRLRNKRAELEHALDGRVRDHHRFLIARHLIHIDFLDEQIADFDEHITHTIAPAMSSDQASSPTVELPPNATDAAASMDSVADSSSPSLTWTKAIEIWDSIPGIGQRAAEQLVAEIGTDMSRFPSAGHLARWARLAPGNHESVGKRYLSKIRSRESLVAEYADSSSPRCGAGERVTLCCILPAFSSAAWGEESNCCRRA